MLNINEINIRDPYVLLSDDTYYLYGTRSESCWTKMDGFDVYYGKNLLDWEGPVEIFHRPDDFFADENFWAPEAYEINGKYYLVSTLGGENIKKGIHVFSSDSPTGPFTYQNKLTPDEWTCIDGTLYFDKNGDVYVIFSRTLEDCPKGVMCARKIEKDLSAPCGDAFDLFYAVDAPWSVPFPFAKVEFGIDGDAYFSDGPTCLKRSDGSLSIIWSSWGPKGYAVGYATSASGKIQGPFKHAEKAIYPENGGHGMLFRTKRGDVVYTLHYPNDKFKERPHFFLLSDENGELSLSEKKPEELE